MLRNLIAWFARRNMATRISVVNAEDTVGFVRFAPWRPDEFITRSGRRFNALPWWSPFNVLLHAWNECEEKEMHDHPRWSITICLQGTIIEHTPWATRTLRPGSIIVRSRKYIHAFTVPPQRGKVWTLFIVGPRNYPQHWFKVRDLRPLGKQTDKGTNDGDGQDH